MSDTNGLSRDTIGFVLQTEKDARRAFRVLRETHTISASGTCSSPSASPTKTRSSR